MRYKLIACKALFRELSHICASSDNIIDATFVRQGYHTVPEKLREMLQAEIDAVESGADPRTNETKGSAPYCDADFDAILIGYGLCSNGIMGLTSKKYPLVIPRGHDCITFFLGSKEKYRQKFEELPGTFWYTASWIDCASLPSAEAYEAEARHYREKGYDEEDIEYMVEANREWVKHYNYAGYIRMPFFGHARYTEYAKKAAADFGWEYKEIPGETSLLEDFIAGRWSEENFLTVSPGKKISPSYDETIIKST